MKRRVILAGALLAVAVIGFTSCEKAEELNVNGIEGVYEGTFSVSNSLKAAAPDTGHHGTAEISLMNDTLMEVHCFGVDIDTTFMLGYYEHNDSILVCLTGDDFEHMYGHMLGEGHMGGGMMDGGMMGDIQNGETQWAHHMNDEHEIDDEHFGGFDMHEMTFTYSFKMMDGSSPYYLRFDGVKQ